MQLHLVGGFLGSGKTTAIAAATKLLMAKGYRVGVITNDQGKYLVDTAFFQLSDVPTVEVTGGCFCCNFDDLQARIDQIQNTLRPDILFAESVGSCADLVATVIKPMLELGSNKNPPSSYSVYCDARLMRLHLNNLPLPFSDNVVYIFDKQIEEAGILVVNKIDLLSNTALKDLQILVQERYPSQTILYQNSRENVMEWIDLLSSGTTPLPSAPLDIDYQRYGKGEEQLAWLDGTVIIKTAQIPPYEAAHRVIQGVVTRLETQQRAIGHLKFVLQTGEGEGQRVEKISYTSPYSRNSSPQSENYGSGSAYSEVKLLVNARVEMPAAELHLLLQQVLDEVTGETGADCREIDISFFHPQFPLPTHRILA